MELDEHKLDMQTDYWLVQIQRLMDRKPQSLIDMVCRHEIGVMSTYSCSLIYMASVGIVEVLADWPEYIMTGRLARA